MLLKTKIILSALGVITCLGLFVYIMQFYHTKEPACSECTRLRAEVTGNSMYPLLKNGDIVDYYMGYYGVNIPKKDDIVIYDFGGSRLPVIKILRVTDHDEVQIDLSNNNLIINGRPMRNSQNKDYIFTTSELDMLGLYIQNGKIPTGSFLIFGDNISESNDSRKFGAISQRNLLGRAFLK